VALVSVAALLTAGCGTSRSPAAVDQRHISQGPSLAGCVQDWNTHSGSSTEAVLALTASDDSGGSSQAAVAVATYSGPTEEVPRVGSAVTPGPPNLIIRQGACLVIEGTAAFIEQSSGSFGYTTAVPAISFGFLYSGQWSQQNANAEVTIDTADAREPVKDQLAATPGASLASITAGMVGGQHVTTQPAAAPKQMSGEPSASGTCPTFRIASLSVEVLASTASCAEAAQVLDDFDASAGAGTPGASVSVDNGWKCAGLAGAPVHCTSAWVGPTPPGYHEEVIAILGAPGTTKSCGLVPGSSDVTYDGESKDLMAFRMSCGDARVIYHQVNKSFICWEGYSLDGQTSPVICIRSGGEVWWNELV
jgi:hypothetical protein